jgi:hypothetical protein
MKKILLSVSFAFATLFASAQCTPSDHDFGFVEYGVYPDVATGLNPAVLNQPYEQIIYVLVPTDAGAIDSAYAGVPISNIILDGISYDYNGQALDFSVLGLNLQCNPANCTFAAGGQYCGVVSGTPNMAGEFPVTINVTVNLTFFGLPIALPFSFPGYTFVVSETAAVEEVANVFEIGAAAPNPSNTQTRIPYSLSNNDQVSFTMMNMVGERVMSKTYAGKRGENTISIDVEELPAGIYLYTVQSGSKKATRKLVVQH